MADLSFTRDALGYRVFANTKAGETAWREMFAANGSDFILTAHWPAFKAAAKAAGYTVRKARQGKPVDTDALLAALLA